MEWGANQPAAMTPHLLLLMAVTAVLLAIVPVAAAAALAEAEADDVRLVVVRVDAAVEARAVGVEVQADGAAQRRHHLERVVRRIGGAGGEAHFVRRGHCPSEEVRPAAGAQRPQREVERL